MKDHPGPERSSSIPGPDRPGPHVLIVGGGASGVLAAAHILRSDPQARVTMVEPRDRIGLGLAYSTPDQNHLLNVRTGNMSALADDSRHFLDWLAARGEDNSPNRFVSRRLYGEYLADLLSRWRTDRPARFRRVQAICIGLTENPSGIVASFDDGTAQLADHAVLATGHSLPRPAADLAIQPAWDPIPALPPDASVLILGTGLTMVDQVLSLLDAGFEGRILAISRRGLLPRAHRPTTPLRLGPQDIPFGAPISAVCRWLRTLARQAERKGGTWRDAMDAVRPFVRRIWRSLPPVERARFLRHGQRWWDIHRHRMPPGSEARLLAAMADGQLTILKGDVLQVDRTGTSILARYRPYRAATSATIPATLAIDARGLRGKPADSPLLARLLHQGTARMDTLGIGLDIANDGSVIRADGTASPCLSAIGPVSPALALARQRAADNLPERLVWGPVTLSVTDLDRAEAFWTEVMGFVRRPGEGPDLSLGTEDRTLVVLAPGATSPVARRHLGMYHVAFRMPSQAEFSRRMLRCYQLQVLVSPVDHLMSKALYLDDPDGHGIEIAFETPERFGRFGKEDNSFAMLDAKGRPHSGRERLDIQAELAQADGTDPALPLHGDATVAHLHLHVPALDPALGWFEGLGFARNLNLPDFGMADMGVGASYTHRLAMNLWAGPGARPAPPNAARLLSYRLETTDRDIFAAARARLTEIPGSGVLTGTDPAGVAVTLALRKEDRNREQAA